MVARNGRRGAPVLYRPPAHLSAKRWNWRKTVLFSPLWAVCGILLNSWYGISDYDTSFDALLDIDISNKSSYVVVTPSSAEIEGGEDWCTTVRRARSDLMPSMHIRVPCETMKPAKSAIVCMLTDGVADDHEDRIEFSATNYVHGAMALGASLMDRIDSSQTHMLLLLREGFELSPEDLIRLESVGWKIGTAPNFPLARRYVPRFPRYKTTYTKVSVIGLAEYECAMLMDADTLAVGDLRDRMTCQLFTEPQHQLGGTLDFNRHRWHFFNTGSILWRTSSKEMNRVFQLTKDPDFMRAFSSDQAFLNSVYPERLNNTLNKEIIAGKLANIPVGQVVDMTWRYNAQTHVEVQGSKFWERHRSDVRILHFTEKKGWQCEERYDPPPPLSEMPTSCDTSIPICFCREAHLYWGALAKAQTLSLPKLAALAETKR